jgi:hypothetical protein
VFLGFRVRPRPSWPYWALQPRGIGPQPTRKWSCSHLRWSVRRSPKSRTDSKPYINPPALFQATHFRSLARWGDTQRKDGCQNLIAAALNDSSEAVRKQALLSLNEWVGADARSIETFVMASKQDSAQEIRDLAFDLLDTQTPEESP